MNKEIQEQKINTMLKHIQNLVVELKGYALPSRAAEAALRGLEVELYREVEYEHFAYYDTGLGHFYWKKEYPEGAPNGFEPVFRMKTKVKECS